MPDAPRRPCTTPACPRLAEVGSKCRPCEAQRRAGVDARRPSASARGYGYAWQRTRARILARDPLCTVDGCGPSEDVDHVVPKAEGGTDDEANLRGVAHRCHSRKTARSDGGFGRRRA